ncbi:hypothetical protein PHET_09443 [Paragonimus heterotremus]|uniref:THAP-type domain-containing protein n=1 Tax=Paragonimus heterotremus TaxID=100268 RepID=A0A8J4T399_9TREM|nr:hypothetical protein PHET_09443 [Paragonimus heterotremus]
MPTTCGFPNCRFRSRYRGAEDNRHFYRVPKKPVALRKRWLEAIGRTEETIVSQLRVCSGHFQGGEKREGDIPVADPSVDVQLRIELPPKSPRLQGNNISGGRIGFGSRGGRGRGAAMTHMNKSRTGLCNFVNRNGTTYFATNPNKQKHFMTSLTRYPYVVSNAETQETSRWPNSYKPFVNETHCSPYFHLTQGSKTIPKIVDSLKTKPSTFQEHDKNKSFNLFETKQHSNIPVQFCMKNDSPVGRTNRTVDEELSTTAHSPNPTFSVSSLKRSVPVGSAVSEVIPPRCFPLKPTINSTVLDSTTDKLNKPISRGEKDRTASSLLLDLNPVMTSGNASPQLFPTLQNLSTDNCVIPTQNSHSLFMHFYNFMMEKSFSGFFQGVVGNPFQGLFKNEPVPIPAIKRSVLNGDWTQGVPGSDVLNSTGVQFSIGGCQPHPVLNKSNEKFDTSFPNTLYQSRRNLCSELTSKYHTNLETPINLTKEHSLFEFGTQDRVQIGGDTSKHDERFNRMNVKSQTEIHFSADTKTFEEQFGGITSPTPCGE